LSDDQLRRLAQAGAVIGIGYWPEAVCGQDIDVIADAVQYAADLIGADHVALGSDYDGTAPAPFDVTGVPMITQALLERNTSEEDIRKIMGENTLRLLRDTLPQQ